jgi:hypothetical protein
MEVLFVSFFAAIFTVAGLMFLFQKMIGWHGIAKHKAKVDIACSVIAFFLFAGTSTLGIMTAVMAGFIASVATSAMGKFMSQEQTQGDLVPVHAESALHRTDNRRRTRSAMARVEAMLQEGNAPRR